MEVDVLTGSQEWTCVIGRKTKEEKEEDQQRRKEARGKKRKRN